MLVWPNGPVSAADIERLVARNRISAPGWDVQKFLQGGWGYGLAGLKEMDLIAYIRYAIVYLGLDDLGSIRNEIDRLLEN